MTDPMVDDAAAGEDVRASETPESVAYELDVYPIGAGDVVVVVDADPPADITI